MIVIKIQNGFEETIRMLISATELESNLSKYLLLSVTEDVFITKKGKAISKLTNPFQSRVDIAKTLIGSISDTGSLEEAKQERLERL